MLLTSLFKNDFSGVCHLFWAPHTIRQRLSQCPRHVPHPRAWPKLGLRDR